ncbi:MAG: GTPase HflX [Myxococcota bacterium]
MVNVRPELPRVVLVGVQIDGVSDVEHAAHLAELGRLCSTLGWRVVATVTQKRQALSRGNVLGEGKLQELAKITGGTGVVGSRAPKRTSKAKEKWQADGEDDSAETAEADNAEADESDGGVETNGEQATMVVVDHELSPNQLSNLERATGVSAMDRSGVIVEIFHRHARSREARLQVEIARLNYLAPRLRESAGSSERQQGRGAGDTAVELDRRRIRDRLAELRRELDSISGDQANRRFARRDQLRVALVGYTNAGKSSLLRALTGSEVLVADQLFATLDTTVRALHPETKPRILVSDTVGFIQKLPHDLVASFRSTLDEAMEASLLLYVVDASDPTFENQLAVTHDVLGEIGASEVPSRLLLNKVDRLSAEQKDDLRRRYPDAIQLSAHAKEDVARLREHIIAYFEEAMLEEDLLIPYSRQQNISEIYANARVISESFDEEGRTLRVRALPAALAKLRLLA